MRLYQRIHSRGEITARKTLVKNPVFVDVFGTLGETDGVPEGSQIDLAKFICCMYGKPSYTDVNKLRHDLTRQKFHRESGSPFSNLMESI